jgi:catechol 2,3-dioxygenase-like lactoylglutathione lyase family enzyme
VNRKTAHNSTYPKVAVQWLNQALFFYQSLCLFDSAVLRNRHLRVAANR